MKKITSLFFAVTLTLVTSASADKTASVNFKVTVSAGKVDRVNVPVRVKTLASSSIAKATTATIVDSDGNRIAGQVTASSLLDGLLKHKQGQASRQVHFILPKLEAGKSTTLEISIPGDDSAADAFQWKETKGKFIELSQGDRPVLRFMNAPLDESRREETYKVFHHVYDPTGSAIVTKGPGGRYTHHRGLFYGFNRISYSVDGEKRSADIWHCRNAHQSHKEVLATETGAVLGRHRLAIDWHGGADKQVFASEQREMTVYNVPGGRLIEFNSILRTNVGPITLDGDPQHAGFQFRASNEVADKTNKQTYYLRPSGKGDPGQTINWNAKTDAHANLPWNAMSFVLGEQRYTCCYLDHPSNPKPARYSERDYGRFGSYFKYELTSDKPLRLRYRIWLQEGEMTVEQVRQLHQNFVDPVATK